MKRGRVEMGETWEQLVSRTGSPKAALRAAHSKLVEHKNAEARSGEQPRHDDGR
jgi:hypothetical protein